MCSPKSHLNPVGVSLTLGSTPVPLLPSNSFPAHLAPNPLLASSPLRPACKAKDRLLLWSPGCARFGNTPANLAQTDIQRIYDVISHAWADSTKATYGSGLLTFHIFCDQKGVPEEDRAPANSILLAAFISTLAGSYSGSAVSNYLSGIKAWHTIHGLDWALNQTETDALLKAASSLAPPSSKRAPREPYTVDTIITIRAQLDLSIPLHAATYACLTTLFYATARTGEFTTRTLTSFVPGTHVKPSDVRVDHDRNGNSVTNFHLPHTKSAPGGEDVSWAKHSGPSDPAAAFDNHIKVNNPPMDGPLFAYRHKRHLRPLTKAKFLVVLNIALKAAGSSPLQGHGIRIGSTLEYLLRNIPFEVVKVKGRWASDAFLLYLRRHAQILAPYMQAQPNLQESFLRLTLPPVR